MILNLLRKLKTSIRDLYHKTVRDVDLYSRKRIDISEYLSPFVDERLNFYILFLWDYYEEKILCYNPDLFANDIPHIGHAYTTIAADIISRWHKILGYDVWFLTGNMEHCKKIQNVAEKANKTPKEFVDALVPKFKEA